MKVCTLNKEQIARANYLLSEKYVDDDEAKELAILLENQPLIVKVCGDRIVSSWIDETQVDCNQVGAQLKTPMTMQ